MAMTAMSRDDEAFYLASELVNPIHTGLLGPDVYLIQPSHVSVKTTACLHLSTALAASIMT